MLRRDLGLMDRSGDILRKSAVGAAIPTLEGPYGPE
jgi:hypothetical protein